MSDPMTPAVPDPTVEALTAVRRYFESHAVTAKATGRDDRDWLDALILLDKAEANLTARAAAPDALTAVCSQCGERSSAMVKIGTSDGWCTACLDEAAEPAPDALRTAWDEGYEAAETMARCWGHTDHWEDEPENPYQGGQL